MIVDELLESAEKLLKKRTIADVVIGLVYTAVKLDDGSCGLAATLRAEITDYCCLFDRTIDLEEQSASSLGELILSTDILESAIGLATINACLNKEVISNTTSVLEALAINKDDVVGMIGYFRPMVESIRQKCKKLYVFERNQYDEKEFLYPDWATNVLLPQCNTVIISGTTFINKTIDHLLQLCQGKKVAILGPSTPMMSTLKQHGIAFTFGVKVRDADRVLKIVSQAGGTRASGQVIEKVNLKL